MRYLSSVLVSGLLLSLAPASGGRGILHTFPEYASPLPVVQVVGDTDTSVLGVEEKFPARGLILSLVLPGAGQWYAGSKWKAVMFAGVELAGLAVRHQFVQRGEEFRVDFERFADEHWFLKDWMVYTNSLRAFDETKYSDVMISGTHHIRIIMPDDSIVTSDTLESLVYDERMKSIRNSEFYENIGKYDQFVAGWDDTGLRNGGQSWWDLEKDTGDSTEWIVMTKNKKSYLKLRKDHNTALKWAGYVVSAIMFNHIVSAVDAFWEIRHQTLMKPEIDTSVGLIFSPYSRYGVGGIHVSVRW